MLTSSLFFFILTLHLSTTLCAPAKRQAQATPVISQDFADPSILNTQRKWYAYATTNGRYNVQVANSTDFSSWTVIKKDAMPNLPAWANPASPQVWAPDVSQRDDGSFLLYFSAALAKFPGQHCVGAATSSTPEGPFISMTRPLVCPDPDGTGKGMDAMIASPGAGGAIDASGFKDADGKRYLLYKVDGNSIGSGGICKNGIAPQRSTPIMLVEVEADGVTAMGKPVQLIDRDNRDGPLVEAPSLMRTQDGTYILFYSSNCFTSTLYDVTWASASRITGPYVKFGPMFVTGNFNLEAPGGASIAADGLHLAFHGNYKGGRAMYTTTVSGSGPNLRASLR
ncbi:Arabinanase/levansucrase/invertase [Trichodelitschia bisporula]|uniref:Arabinanase/levansucrase/invertase n=1 Tax=Trichodelitschia bisporula TaxID=703511 RepID=A0A6G1IAV7_9PEZI|nr:Arabinanase/levansucrase/invertase [Trichodelitschia bisporula]